MKFYIAARFTSQSRQRYNASKLVELGHDVTSGWIFAERPESPTEEFFEAQGPERANQDLDDLHAADHLVLDTTHGFGTRGGMMFEAGHADHANMGISVIGNPPGVFLRDRERYASWQIFLEAVANGRVK